MAPRTATDDRPVQRNETLTFSVASRLWRELGERLVGRKAIALAELIKNSYDADATEVIVKLDLEESAIVVEDNGDGMSWNEFSAYWATVGDTHKERKPTSDHCNRSLTGSKGVGRISTRILGDTVRVRTVSRKDPFIEVIASVDWKAAMKLDLLTQTPIDCRIVQHARKQQHGTTIEIGKISGKWDEKEIREMGGEVWKLQPPFPNLRPKSSRCSFEVRFESPHGELTRAFDDATSKILDAYEARIRGKILDGVVTAVLEFGNDAPISLEHRFGEGALTHAEFEIRVYRLKGHQRGGLKLQDVEEYLRDFRGVHIYDSGFRLPYYGYAEADWLGLTMDQARRLSMSKLLPDELIVPEGLLHLPHVDHLLGAVTVNTSSERQLSINIGRDRLKEEESGFKELRAGIRTVLDWYANQKAIRRIREISVKAETEPPVRSLNEIVSIVDDFRDVLPEKTANKMETALRKVVHRIRHDDALHTQRLALMASLATAGVAAVAYQHEMSKQVLTVESLVETLSSRLAAEQASSTEETQRLLDDLRQWIERTKAIGGLFAHFADVENVQAVHRYDVQKVVTHVQRETHPLLKDVSFSQKIEPGLRFPSATLADWVAILQNVVFNAANAVQESREKRIRFVGRKRKKTSVLLVQDTGSGVDLKRAEHLFEPFHRSGRLSPERRAAGFGGMGLGLTIVQMVAEQRDCKVSFVEPERGFSTAFRLEWRD